MRVCRMRPEISITLKPAIRRRLAALAKDRNAAHKQVWRAEIVLLSAAGSPKLTMIPSHSYGPLIPKRSSPLSEEGTKC